MQTINRSHIPRMDFHMHTRWTDGGNSAAEMHGQSVVCGLESILFSEHARKSSGDWFSAFTAEVRALPTDACKALVGAETKVESLDGDLDCTQDILVLCDLVMASVHRFPGEFGTVKGFGDVDPAKAAVQELQLAMAAMDNPSVDILGHPFGMCYRRFHVSPSEHQIRTLIDKASETGTAFEINSHYHPEPWRLIEWCQSAGAPISLGSNAHDLATVGKMTRILEGKEQAWTLSACS